jgi:cobalt-zinc-cadmium efflux system outer membrane protein
MRVTPIVIAVCLALAGCQTVHPPRSNSAPGNTPQRLPALPAASAVTVPSPQPSSSPNALVQQAQHVEPVVPPEPEPLPPGRLKPVTVGALTLGDLEQMALSANPSVARSAALVEAARGNWVQVGLPPNPSVGYEGQQIGSLRAWG